MDQIRKSLEKYYQTDEYFKDAKALYINKYLSIYNQRFKLGILLVFFLVLFYMINGIISDFNNKSENYLYYVGLKDDTQELVKFQSIDHALSEKAAVAEYLIKQYIINFESYDYNKLANQYNFIKKNSEANLLQQFLLQLDLSNDESPILKFKENGVIKIKNISVAFEQVDYGNVIKATVKFKKTAILNGKVIADNWENRSIIISLNDLSDIVNQQKPLNYIVKSYKIILS